MQRIALICFGFFYWTTLGCASPPSMQTADAGGASDRANDRIDSDSETSSPEIATATESADAGARPMPIEEPDLPPSLSHYYSIQLGALRDRRSECSIAGTVDLPSDLVEHLTTREEYEHHRLCLHVLEQLDCDAPSLKEGQLARVENCLYAEPTIYDALDRPEVCPFSGDDIVFDHPRRKFSLSNAYWLLSLSTACNLDDADLIREEMASQGFENVEVLVRKRLTVAIVEEDAYIIFVFKGSTSTSDYLSNAAYVMNETQKTGIPGKVHSGFYGTLNSGWPALKAALLSAAETGKTIIFTGHSLGGACSQLAAMKADKLGIEIAQIYNFAAPRAGNQAYADAFEERFGGRFYRVNNGLDITPHVPPSATAEQAAKDAILDLIGDSDDPGPILEAISSILDFGLQFAAYTHPGDEYLFNPTGYLLALWPYTDDNEIPYWKNLHLMFKGGNIFDITSELGVLPEYHDERLQTCYQARAVHQLIYERRDR